jgi:hypothetical protein
MLWLVLRALSWAVAGAVILPIIGFVILLAVFAVTPVCGSGGDSGGCAMGMASILMMLIPAGAVVFAIGSVVRDLRRRPG